jgi:hypothetical protein
MVRELQDNLSFIFIEDALLVEPVLLVMDLTMFQTVFVLLLDFHKSYYNRAFFAVVMTLVRVLQYFL